MSASITKPPFRADHVGSLLRPEVLHQARAKAKAGNLSQSELKSVEDRCIREVVAKQESIGLQAITDGELRRDYWHLDFVSQLDGVALKRVVGLTFQAEDVPPMATGKSTARKRSVFKQNATAEYKSGV